MEILHFHIRLNLVLATFLLAGAYCNHAHAADYRVGPDTRTFDCAAVKPGDTITLEAGTRGPLRVKDCNGTKESKIVIRNDPNSIERTTVSRSSSIAGGFIFDCVNCVGVAIDGTMAGVKSPGGKSYGILLTIDGGESPAAFLKISGLSRFVTVRGIEVDGAWPRLANNGIGIAIHDNNVQSANHPGVWYEGFLIENNYLHDIEGEGMYVGANWYGNDDLPLRDISIKNNIVEDTGWEAIQVKSSVSGANVIERNVVRRSGKIPGFEGQISGISLYEGNGKIFNNWIEDTGGSGISVFTEVLPESFGPQVVEVFNNVITRTGLTAMNKSSGVAVSSKRNAIGIALPAPVVYNNTIVDAGHYGISVGTVGSGSVVRNNILVDSGERPILAAANVLVGDNISGAAEEMFFVDAGSMNYELTVRSPARDKARGIFPSFDFVGRTRPSGDSPDCGAFEWFSSAPAAPISLVVK